MIKYNFDEMRAKAANLEAILPELINAGDYEKIRTEALALRECWEGQAADAFMKFASEATSKKNPEMCYRMPELIRSSADNMERKQEQLAEEVKRSFSNLRF